VRPWPKFALEGAVNAATFFRDYAELLARTNRPDEAARLQARAHAAGVRDYS
jgi:hypothetical protein